MSILAWNRTGYDQKRYNSRKQELEAILGGRCRSCGETENLEFDHISPDTKSFAITSRWTAGDSALLPELRKCQLLCASCHMEKTVAATSVEHGGGVSGKKNCKCDLCRDRKNEYMRDWKRARRKLAVTVA